MLNEVKNKILNITNLATITALTAVENKTPNVNKITTDHDHDKYITTQEFNKLISDNLTARLKQAYLTSKSDIVNFVKKIDLNKNELNEL